MKNRPTYAIASVDAALLLATLLQQEGAMRVTDVARRLEVSVSTAHRLLGMLVYRDFAEQLPDRRYGPGRALQAGVLPQPAVARLREAALPHLRWAVDQLGETVSALVLAGTDVRFVTTVECDHVLRVGDRTGRSLPALLSSGGKALLAHAPADDLAARLATLDPGAAARVRRELATVRRRGYAVNDQATEAGLTAIGVAVPDRARPPWAAVSLAMPTVRHDRSRVGDHAAVLAAAADAIAAALPGGSRALA